MTKPALVKYLDWEAGEEACDGVTEVQKGQIFTSLLEKLSGEAWEMALRAQGGYRGAMSELQLHSTPVTAPEANMVVDQITNFAFDAGEPMPQLRRFMAWVSVHRRYARNSATVGVSDAEVYEILCCPVHGALSSQRNPSLWFYNALTGAYLEFGTKSDSFKNWNSFTSKMEICWRRARAHIQSNEYLSNSSAPTLSTVDETLTKSLQTKTVDSSSNIIADATALVSNNPNFNKKRPKPANRRCPICFALGARDDMKCKGKWDPKLCSKKLIVQINASDPPQYA